MKHLLWKNLLLVGYVFNVSIFIGKVFFLKVKNTGVFKDVRNKLFANNEKQIDNHVLMLYMLPS